MQLQRIRFFVMAGLRPGHPRLSCCHAVKTWMPGTSPGMTGNFLRVELVRKSDIVPQASQNRPPTGKRKTRDARFVAGVRNPESVRQSRLDGIAVPRRLAGGYRLRAGLA